MTNSQPYLTPRRQGFRRNRSKIIFIFFAGIGALLLILGCYLIWDDHNFKQTALTSTGVITKIDVTYDSDDDASHTVFVAFTLDGRKYEGRLGYYISGMYVGKDIKLYYNPANPADFRGSGSIVGSIVFAVFGGVFLTIGLIPLLLSGKKRFLSGRKHRRRDALIQKGRRIDVKVAEIYRNTRVSVNGAHPYKIRCRGFDHLGQLREFESEDIWHDPAPRIEQLRIKSLPVYLHETKPRKYYVDIRALQSS